MKNNNQFSLLAWTFLLASASASSADIAFNGFASIIAGATLDRDEAAFGYDNNIAFDQESRFALQVTAKLSDEFSATAQMIARGRLDYDTDLEWAYISYTPDRNNKLTAGRIRIPFYRLSEYIDTGYAYPWLRVPKNVYNSSFNSWDGLSWINNHYIGHIDGRFQLQWGNLSDSNLVTRTGSVIEIDFEGFALEYVATSGAWQARLGYISSEIEVISSLNAAFNASISSIENNTDFTVPKEYTSNFLLDGDTLTFISSSIMYDDGEIFVGGEIIDATYDDLSINPDIEAWYIAAGYYLNDWTFHLTYGITDRGKRQHTDLVDESTVDPTLNQLLQGITNGYTARGALAGEESDFYTLGVNYGFHQNAVLKIEFTHYENDIDVSFSDADILSIGIDLVF